ncbi:MAG: response regulator [Eubacteriales bacterium]
MIRILLVDDDIILLNRISGILEIHNSLCSVVERAMSGTDAVKAVERCKPDVIFMDVELPQMNGIEATKAIKDRYPSIHIVALSNYDNFFYLREMLKSGAADYILKHELSVELLEQQLHKISKLLQVSMDTEKEDVEESIWEKQEYFGQLLFDEEKQIDVDRIFQKQIQKSTSYGFIVFQIVNFAVYYEKKKKENLLKSVLTILHNILPGESLSIEIEHGEYAVFMQLENSPSTHVMQNNLKEYVMLIRSNLLKMLNIQIIDYQKVLYHATLNLAQSYCDAEKMIGSSVINYDDSGKSNMLLIQCLNYVINQEEEYFFDTFDIIFQYGKSQEINLPFVHKNVAEMIQLIRNYLKSKSNYKAIEEEYSKNVNQLFKSQSVQECEEIFHTIIGDLFVNIRKSRINQYSEYILQALDYLEKNYREDISLNMIAEHIGISSVYLSKLFKKEVEINFIAYLTQYRLRKSEKYVLDTKLSIKEIAKKVGYNNFSYFVSLFKQEYGCPPMEFRNQKLK